MDRKTTSSDSGGTHLHAKLGVLEIFCIASGGMISSGLFVLPGLVYQYTGPAACLVYLLAGILVIPGLMCKAELATAMPKAGGDYFFIDRSLGAAFGTLGGIATWFSLSLKSAFALYGVGVFGLILEPNLPGWAIRATAVAACVVLTFFNLRGVKEAGRLQIGFVLVLLSGLIVYLFRGLGYMQPMHFENFIRHGWADVWAATGLVFVSYGGLTKVASLAEETENPGRTLPVGMFIAFGVNTILYVMVVLVTVGLLGEKMDGNLNPLIYGAEICLGTPGIIIVSIAALLAYLSTGNAGIMASSRVPLAMSRDELLPESFSRIHPTRGTPRDAIWFTTAFMIAAILFLKLETLVKVASTMMILLFLLICLAVILMRESRIDNYQPKYFVPFYPYVPIAGIIAYFFLVMEMGPGPLALTALFFGGGLLWYGFYGRIRSNRESALIRVVERVIPSVLSSGTLEDELRDILRDREGIVEDRFDRLIRDCDILDIEGDTTIEKFLELASETLAKYVELPEKEIEKMLHEREMDSSTVVKPGLAIPHIIVPGKDEFHVVLVRSKSGIPFGGSKEPVHTAFVLAGSEDVRNYHLRVLMYIAQIAQGVDFEKRWMAARDAAALRDLVLLAKRTREKEQL